MVPVVDKENSEPKKPNRGFRRVFKRTGSILTFVETDHPQPLQHPLQHQLQPSSPQQQKPLQHPKQQPLQQQPQELSRKQLKRILWQQTVTEKQKRQQKLEQQERQRLAAQQVKKSKKQQQQYQNQPSGQPMPPIPTRKDIPGPSKDVNGPLTGEYLFLPHLIPIAAPTGYSLKKDILAQIENLKAALVYHVWLDCLYDPGTTYEQIYRELSVLFKNAAEQRILKVNNVFVVGQMSTGGPIKPAGSCFILFDCNNNDIRQKIDLAIYKADLHMISLDVITLAAQITNKHFLILRDGYKDLLRKYHPNVFFKACDLPPPKKIKVAPPPVVSANVKAATVALPVVKPAPIVPTTLPVQTEPVRSRNEMLDSLMRARSELVKEPEQAPPVPKRAKKKAKTGTKPNQKVNGLDSNLIDPEKFEEMLTAKVEQDAEQNESVSKLLPDLLKHGNSVIRIDNLPAKLTVHAFNLMMGTYKIVSDQVVARILSGGKKGRELMNIRVIVPSNHEDINRMLTKNNCMTYYDSSLIIKRTDVKELENFLRKNSGLIQRLESNDDLPIHRIGYGNVQNLN